MNEEVGFERGRQKLLNETENGEGGRGELVPRRRGSSSREDAEISPSLSRPSIDGKSKASVRNVTDVAETHANVPRCSRPPAARAPPAGLDALILFFYAPLPSSPLRRRFLPSTIRVFCIQRRGTRFFLFLRLPFSSPFGTRSIFRAICPPGGKSLRVHGVFAGLT